MKRMLGAAALAAALVGGGMGPALLAQPAKPAPSPAATDGFVPVTDLPPSEQLPAAPLVLFAYAVIWMAVLVYVWLLWRRLAAVQKDLDALKHSSSR